MRRTGSAALLVLLGGCTAWYGDRFGSRPAPCPPPYLLVASSSYADAVPGRVLRAAIPTGDQPPVMCDPLDGGGALPAQLRAVTSLGGARVAVAAKDALVLLDEADDRALWTQAYPDGFTAVDVFPLQDLSGATNVAVGLRDAATQYGDIVRVVVRSQAGELVADWKLDNVALPLGPGVRSLAASELRPKNFYALGPPLTGPNAELAWEIDPNTGAIPTNRGCQTCETNTPRSIATAVIGGVNRGVWAQQGPSDRPTFSSADLTELGGEVQVSCDLTFHATLHAVPDPTVSVGSLLLTATAGGASVLRSSDGKTCHDFIPTSAAPRGSMERLALVH